MKFESDVALVLINVFSVLLKRMNEIKNKNTSTMASNHFKNVTKKKSGTYKLSIGDSDDGNSKRISFHQKKMPISLLAHLFYSHYTT